jgi:hypothetical protein
MQQGISKIASLLILGVLMFISFVCAVLQEFEQTVHSGQHSNAYGIQMQFCFV